MDENDSKQNIEKILVKGDCPKCKKHTIFEKASKEIDSILSKYSDNQNLKEYYLCTQCYYLIGFQEIRSYYDFQVNGKYKDKEIVKKYSSRKKIKEELKKDLMIFP